MRKVIGLLLAISTSSLFASTYCGDSESEKNHSNLNWEKLGQIKVNSSYGGVSGVLCLGLNQKTSELSRVVYKDDSGININKDVVEFSSNDIPVVKKKDLPDAAQPIIRNMTIITFKVKEIMKGKYELSVKFLRNIAKGFKRADIRDFNFDFSTSKTESSISSQFEKIGFERLDLNVSGGLKIDRIHLNSYGKRVKSISTSSLPRGRRVLPKN